jgi:hypothetical protein
MTKFPDLNLDDKWPRSLDSAPAGDNSISDQAGRGGAGDELNDWIIARINPRFASRLKKRLTKIR